MLYLTSELTILDTDDLAVLEAVDPPTAGTSNNAGPSGNLPASESNVEAAPASADQAAGESNATPVSDTQAAGESNAATPSGNLAEGAPPSYEEVTDDEGPMLPGMLRYYEDTPSNPLQPPTHSNSFSGGPGEDDPNWSLENNIENLTPQAPIEAPAGPRSVVADPPVFVCPERPSRPRSPGHACGKHVNHRLRRKLTRIREDEEMTLETLHENCQWGCCLRYKILHSELAADYHRLHMRYLNQQEMIEFYKSHYNDILDRLG